MLFEGSLRLTERQSSQFIKTVLPHHITLKKVIFLPQFVCLSKELLIIIKEWLNFHKTQDKWLSFYGQSDSGLNNFWVCLTLQNKALVALQLGTCMIILTRSCQSLTVSSMLWLQWCQLLTSTVHGMFRFVFSEYFPVQFIVQLCCNKLRELNSTLCWQWDRTSPSRKPSVAGTLGKTLHT